MLESSYMKIEDEGDIQINEISNKPLLERIVLTLDKKGFAEELIKLRTKLFSKHKDALSVLFKEKAFDNKVSTLCQKFNIDPDLESVVISALLFNRVPPFISKSTNGVKISKDFGSKKPVIVLSANQTNKEIVAQLKEAKRIFPQYFSQNTLKGKPTLRAKASSNILRTHQWFILRKKHRWGYKKIAKTYNVNLETVRATLKLYELKLRRSSSKT